MGAGRVLCRWGERKLMMKGSVIFLVVSWVRKVRGRRRCVVGRDVDECLKRFGGGGGSISRCVVT